MDGKGILEQLLMHYAHGNQSEFARLIGCKQGVIAGWIRRDTIDAQRIKSALPQVDGNWLLTGEGEMLLPGDGTSAVSVKGDHNTTHVNSHNTTTQPAASQEGGDTGQTDAQVLQTKVDYLESLLAEKERLISVLMERK